jgi:nucleoside-diphosphate-sugar epimerase
MEFVVLQPTNIIGHVPGYTYPLLGLISTIKTRRFSYFGTHDTWVNYVDVEDVAAAIKVAVRSGRVASTYIVNTPARLVDLVDWISDAIGVTVPSRRMPAWLGASAGAACSVLQRVVSRPLSFSAERYRELTNTTRYDDSALRRELGFVYPIGIEAAVRRLALAYLAKGLI